MHMRDSILYAKLQRPGRFGPGLLVEYFMDIGCLTVCFLSSLVNANMIDIIMGLIQPWCLSVLPSGAVALAWVLWRATNESSESTKKTESGSWCQQSGSLWKMSRNGMSSHRVSGTGTSTAKLGGVGQ